MDKILKTVLSGFLLCAIIVPLKNIDLSFEFSFPNGHIYSEESTSTELFDKQTRELAEHKIAMLAQTELEKISVIPQKIEVFTDNDDITSISIITIEVTVGSEYAGREQEIKKTLESELGLSVTVERN